MYHGIMPGAAHKKHESSSHSILSMWPKQMKPNTPAEVHEALLDFNKQFDHVYRPEQNEYWCFVHIC